VRARLQPHLASLVLGIGVLLQLGALGLTFARFYA
jgi:hypothetical protein